MNYYNNETYGANFIGCKFPFVLPNCNKIYANEVFIENFLWRIIILSLSIISLIFIIHQIYRVIKYKGSIIQKGKFFFLI